MLVLETNDHRSYRITSEKIKEHLNFQFKYSIQDAVKELIDAFESGALTNTFSNNRFYNIKTMLAEHLT